MYKKFIEERTKEGANLLIKENLTLREIAKCLGCSKSTIHKDIIERLPKINYGLYKEARQILDKHLEERSIRGGQATKELFLRLSKNN